QERALLAFHVAYDAPQLVHDALALLELGDLLGIEGLSSPLLDRLLQQRKARLDQRARVVEPLLLAWIVRRQPAQIREVRSDLVDRRLIRLEVTRVGRE